MPTLELKPTHKAVLAYYESLAKFAELGVKHESAVRLAFHELLDHCGRQFDWKLVAEYAIKRKGQTDAKADGALLDNYGLNHGLWEAKDSDDDLDKEIKRKFAIGYPKQNILFWQPDYAVLYQNSDRFYEADLTKPEDLVHVLKLFLEFAPPAIAEWEKAVDEFRDKVPQIGASLKALIENERQTNQKFITAFDGFCSLCRGSVNPNISIEAVEEMIIQHILTERIFRKIFDVADFISRNVIAQEIEKVISALTSRSFSRDDFSKSLEHFYGAIENAAATITDFHEKQTFLNTVYERFFQGFCVKVADTHGIVYTPQPLVNFMVASVEHVLKEEFGKTLSDRDVHILDPFTGTGNFIVNIMRHIPKSALPHKYAQELHCNEIMLLPYYVASMNIEHAYYEATGKYEPFDGICLVDTFQTAEKDQPEFSFFNEKNSERVKKQKKAPIRVIIANPPYNANQVNENDNNKNRKYGEIDDRVRNTYVTDSGATLRNKLGDPYVKAYRWASDRLGKDGVVVYVSNNSFLEDKQFDGVRKHLAHDFSDVWVLDLKGDARTAGERRRQEGGNVFSDMIRVGVCVSILVRRSDRQQSRCNIRIHRVPDYWKCHQKLGFLERHIGVSEVQWEKITPDESSNWLNKGMQPDFAGYVPLGVKKPEEAKRVGNQPLFRSYTLGASTNRDEVVYDFSEARLAKRAKAFMEAYNTEIDRYNNAGRPANVDDFVDQRLKWSRDLKGAMLNGERLKFAKKSLRRVQYRPFTEKSLCFQNTAVDRIGPLAHFFPRGDRSENRAICLTGPGSQKEFFALMTASAADLHFVGAASATQIFPLFTYTADEQEKQDNITPKAITLFRIFHDDDGITHEQIFHYVYALLHHPTYRTRYAHNLTRTLPRIPFVGVELTSLSSHSGKMPTIPQPQLGSPSVAFFPASSIKTMQGDAKPDHDPKASAKLFHAFADAGKKLADLHVNYESAKEFTLKRQENKDVPLDWRVEAMKLSKDKASLFYNGFWTLSGIPSEVYEYRLGNRSALEWVIDQYRVTRDEQGNIASDPNRPDDEQYIMRLIGQVITVSLETMKLVKSLPEVQFA